MAKLTESERKTRVRVHKKHSEIDEKKKSVAKRMAKKYGIGTEEGWKAHHGY